MLKILKTKSEIDSYFKEKQKQNSNDDISNIEKTVSEIISDVRDNGDVAVVKYSQKFDNVSQVREVTYDEITDAVDQKSKDDPDFIDALLNCIGNITEYHQNQVQQGFCVTKDDGVMLGSRVRGLDKVGLYVPGGTAAYPSSVLMNAIPARIAGVKELIVVTPPQKDGTANLDILTACRLVGVDRVFLVGGAQAVAALAYGTETIPKVDKIVGPGNIFVATAKKQVFGIVDIDMIAGPSEILMLCDEKANQKYIAADLISQAEHDVRAGVVLVTPSEKLIHDVIDELKLQTRTIPRKDFILKSFENSGIAILVEDMQEAVEIANVFAPEHLEVLTENPFEYIGKIDNAGSVFLGEYSPEPLGDYFAGANHVLPTGGTAKFFSPLSVDSFIKKSSYIYYPKDALIKASKDIITVAEREGLFAHAAAVRIRTENQ